MALPGSGPQITGYTSQGQCPRNSAGERLSPARSLVRWGAVPTTGLWGCSQLTISPSPPSNVVEDAVQIVFSQAKEA